MKKYFAMLAMGAMMSTAVAADFPGRETVTINLGFPAGGGMDVMTRIIQRQVEEILGNTVIIDYRPGAGGNIASNFVAKAKPTGHTLLVGTAATHGINDALYKDLTFDVEADFTPIAKFVDAPNVLVINPSAVNADNIEDFAKEVRANPGKYSYASSGYGTSGHLATADVFARMGLEVEHVPFKGGPDAMLSLLRGEVCCFLTQVQVALSQLKNEQIKAVAVTTKERVSALPDVPTMSETVLPDYENSLWFGLFGPAGMDAAVVDTLSSAVGEALKQDSVVKDLEALGNVVSYQDAATFKETVKNDRVRWTKIVNDIGVKIE